MKTRPLKDARRLPFWPHWSLDGITNLRRGGFSLNEGVFPRLGVSWQAGLVIVGGLAPGLTFGWTSSRARQWFKR